MTYDFKLSGEDIARVQRALAHAAVTARTRAAEALNEPTKPLGDVRRLCDEYATLRETLEWWGDLAEDVFRRDY